MHRNAKAAAAKATSPRPWPVRAALRRGPAAGARTGPCAMLSPARRGIPCARSCRPSCPLPGTARQGAAPTSAVGLGVLAGLLGPHVRSGPSVVSPSCRSCPCRQAATWCRQSLPSSERSKRRHFYALWSSKPLIRGHQEDELRGAVRSMLVRCVQTAKELLNEQDAVMPIVRDLLAPLVAGDKLDVATVHQDSGLIATALESRFHLGAGGGSSHQGFSVDQIPGLGSWRSGWPGSERPH